MPRVPFSANLFGTTAGVVGVSTSWPQAWRLWIGRRHAGLSLSSNVLGVLYSIAWLLYGVLCHSTLQILTSAAGLCGSVAIFAGHVVRAGLPLRSWLPLFSAGAFGVGIAYGGGRLLLGVAASVATIAGVVPQAAVLARARRSRSCDSRGVSRARWLLSAGCNALWVGYGAIVGDQLIAVNSTVIAALGLTIVALTVGPRRAAASSPAPISQVAEAMAA